MNLQHAPTMTAGNSDLHNTRDPRLYGRWLILARIGWVAVVGLALGLFMQYQWATHS